MDDIGKGRKDAPMQEMDKARGTIVALSTTDESTRRNKSLKDMEPTPLEDMEHVEAGQGRKDSPRKKSEKRTLAAFQTEEAPESLRCPGSRRSTSEDSVTQEEAELSEKRTEPATSDNTTEPMAKAYIETVDVDDDDKSTSDLEM